MECPAQKIPGGHCAQERICHAPLGWAYDGATECILKNHFYLRHIFGA